MTGICRARGRPDRRSDGSALLLVLFVCLAVAVLVQTLTLVTMCAQRAQVVEREGRALMAERDAGLVGLIGQARCRWGAQPADGSDSGPSLVEAGLSEVGTSRWVFGARCWQTGGPAALTTSACGRSRTGLYMTPAWQKRQP